MAHEGWPNVDRAYFAAQCRVLGIDLSEDQLMSFEHFEEDLYEMNTVMNLTRVPRELCAERHFLDSLLLAEFLSGRVLDLGCGPGFPSWPLALARPDLHLTALDSSNKMLGFLARHPLPNLAIVNARAEQYAAWGRFDCVTGRAVAPLAIQLELSARLVRMKGKVIPMRTPSDLAEIERLSNVLGLRLERIERRALPGTEVERVFPIWTKVALTPKGYPRVWAEIKRHPL